MESRIATQRLKAQKNATPIVVLTAYTAPIARILDAHVDILLVGDSMGMVLYGMENTQSVTLDMMIAHGRAVVKSSSRAAVVVDMPFGSYHQSKEQALENCRRVMDETGCSAVKLEGGVETADTIAHLVASGIPVMGHVGLMPQRVNTPSGYRYQGRTDEEAAVIMADALAIEKAGAFCMVIEAVKEDVARAITQKLKIPTIGIGASPACDGQVLVIDDMLGLSARSPSFVRKYADLSAAIAEAAKAYTADVKSHAFPSMDYCFTGKKKS